MGAHVAASAQGEGSSGEGASKRWELGRWFKVSNLARNSWSHSCFVGGFVNLQQKCIPRLARQFSSFLVLGDSKVSEPIEPDKEVEVGIHSDESVTAAIFRPAVGRLPSCSSHTHNAFSAPTFSREAEFS